MALKAGLVGVNPKGVDKNGMPKAGDTYTKLEINQMMASKVPVSQLRANNKDFNFAYDSTTEKYGYKAGADGDFVPFDGAGMGIVVTNPLTTGIELPDTGVELLEGGYEINNATHTATIYMKLHNTTGNAFNVVLPFAADTGSNKSLMLRIVKSSDFEIDNYNSIYYTSQSSVSGGKTTINITGTYIYLVGYIRIAS